MKRVSGMISIVGFVLEPAFVLVLVVGRIEACWRDAGQEIPELDATFAVRLVGSPALDVRREGADSRA
jgi:hypothetical protein